MRNAKSILALALLGLVPVAHGQTGQTPTGMTISTLVKKGDTVIGLGAVQVMTDVAINDSKTWMTLLGTDFSDQNRDGCLLSNGFVAMREGTPLFGPVGSTLDDWLSFSLTNRGDLGMVLRTKPPAPAAPVEGVFRNLVPVAMRGNVISSPHLGGPPNFQPSTWDGFFAVKMNSNNELFVLGEIQNTQLMRAKERSLVRFRLDDAGNVLETTVLATEGMTVPTGNPGFTLAGALCLPNTQTVLSVNERGDFLTMIGNDSLQIRALVINMQQIVAQTGLPSPVGKPWRELSLSRVALNDRGDWVISGAVGLPSDTDGYLIVKNNQKFAQQGDVLPGFATNLQAGSQAPIYVANNGDVFWHARVVNSDSFMRNYEQIIVAGRTVLSGNLVITVNSTESAFAISPNGRFWLGSVELQSIGTTAVFVDFGLILDVPGCFANPGKLSYSSGKALVGKTFTLAMDEGQHPGVSTNLLMSSRPLISPAGCGVNIEPYGELMLAPPLVGPRPMPAWDGTNPSLVTIRIPNRISLVDAVFFAQGLFLSPGHPTEPFRLTNAMRIEVGAP